MLVYRWSLNFLIFPIPGGSAGLGSAGPSSTSVAKYIAGKDEQVQNINFNF